jgi:hypothetical protein
MAFQYLTAVLLHSNIGFLYLNVGRQAISSWAVGWLAVAAGAVIFANHHISTLGAFNLAAISAALVLLGPGAFSLDARLFGRREIIFPEGRRSPRR